MSTKTYFINSPDASYNDNEIAWMQSTILAEGIVGDDAGAIGLATIENAVPDMDVLVGVGKALVEVTISGRTFKVVVEVTAQEQLTLAANSSGSNRLDAVIVRVDKDAVPNVLKTNIATIEVVQGSGVTALTDGAIDTAVGNDGWYRLADVTVPDSATSIINANITDTRQTVATTPSIVISGGVPTGMVSQYAGDVAPSGFELCRGQEISRTTFANLFAIIGEKFGVGDGSTTFNVPDIRSRSIFGLDDTETLLTLEDCEDAWNESVASSVTVNVDADSKVGTNSVEIIVGDAVTAGTILATEAIVSKDLRLKGVVSQWIKSTVALNAGDLQLLLDDTASCASPLESIDVPAIPANTWVRVHLPLADKSADTAIISIGLKMVVDKGAFTINIDDIVASDFAELGALGGESQHKLSVAELASHTHSFPENSGAGGVAGVDTYTVTGAHDSNPTGGDLGHYNIPPFIVLNNLIKT